MASPSPAGAATTSPHPPSCSCIYDGDGGRPRSIAAAVRQLVREGQRRWLKTREVVTLLLHHDEAGLALATVPPCNPPSGAMFVFEKEQVPRFRQDGVSWKTKRERNVIRENHETLMLDRHEMLVVSYAHSADVPGFHRRCYALLADRNRVLVHYLLTHPPPQPATAAPVPVPAVAASPVVDGLSAPASPFAPFDSSSVHEPQLHLPNQPYAGDASEGEARVAPVTAATPTWQPRRSVHVQTSLFGTGPLLSSSVPASPLAPAPARTPSPSLAMGTAALMPAQGPSAFEPQHASLSPWAAEFDMAFAHGAAAAAASAATPTPAAAASSPSPWQPFYEALEPTEARLPWHAESRVQLRPLLHAAKRDYAATGSTAPPACAFVEGEHELSDMQLMQLAAGELPLELRLTTDETLVSSSPPSPSRSESVAYEPQQPPPEPAIDLAPAPSNSREDTTGAATPEQQPDEPQQQSHEPQQQQQQWRSEIRTVAPRWVLAPGGVQVVIVCDTALSDVLAATSATTSASTVVCRFGDVLTEATLVAPNVVSTVCPSFSDEADVAVSVGVLSPNGRELYDLTDAVAFKYHSLESLVREYEFPGSQPQQQQQQQQQHMMVLQEGHSSSAAAALQSTAIDDAQVPPLSASASLSSTSAAAAALELVQSSGLSTEALLTLHSLLDHGVSSGNGGGGGGGGSGHSSGILMLGSEAAALEGAHDYDEIVARFECAITQVCQRMDDRPDRINKQDEHGRTLLHYSALLGYQTMTQLLLQIGGVASLSIHDAITGGTPLHAACTAGHAQLVRLMVGKVASVPPATALPLLRMRSSTGKTPLQVAVACSRRDIAQILTDAEVTVLQRLAAAESQRNSSGSASPVWAASGFSSSSSSSSASSGSSSVSLLSSPLSPASRGTTVTSPGPLLSLSLSQVSVGDGANSSIEPPAPSMEEAMNTIQCLYKAHQGRRKKLEHEEQVLQQAVIKIQASFRRYLVSKVRERCRCLRSSLLSSDQIVTTNCSNERTTRRQHSASSVHIGRIVCARA